MKKKIQDLNILFVAEKYTKMRPSGKSGNYKGLSPFTREKTPSFFVHARKRVWRCFSTGFSGCSPVTLVMAIERCTEDQALKKIESFFNNDPPSGVTKKGAES